MFDDIADVVASFRQIQEGLKACVRFEGGG